MTDQLLNVKQTAELLGCSSSLLNLMRSNGEGPPYVKLTDAANGRIAYRHSDLTAWLETRVVAS